MHQPITRPPVLGRDEAERIAVATAAALGKVHDERQYREYVLVTLAELKVRQEVQKEALDAHMASDLSQFATVNQSIDNNDKVINRFLGALALLTILGSAIAWLVNRFWPSSTP